ncbi:hypothetical protein PV327_002311 [Microctonus hyperodae]|uniref:Uncharacterized protein n=1 Tax=Microctonus hyperodae TaxID=165561 RepID=A0AA39KP71_MICHY|nr:hypothetical protein PV327_002311 [Microctonus hyperodae]
MADRDNNIIDRIQLGRNSIGPTRKYVVTLGGSRSSHEHGDNHDNERPASPAHENLKQWELIEGDRGLRVVEKRTTSVPMRSIKSYAAPPPPSKRLAHSVVEHEKNLLDEELARKFKAFERSSIVQAVPSTNDNIDGNYVDADDNINDNGNPIALNVILQSKDRVQTDKSTDVLDQLERQVKAIEMGTIVAQTKLRDSTDLEPEIQLRYREHEDLLNNVTDDEAEG